MTTFNQIIDKSIIFITDIDFWLKKLFIIKTLRDMANYENVCKNARETLKQSLLACGKEHLKHRPQQRNSVCEISYMMLFIYIFSIYFTICLLMNCKIKSKSIGTNIFYFESIYFLFIFVIHLRLLKKTQVPKYRRLRVGKILKWIY